MPLKAIVFAAIVPAATITSGPLGTQGDTSIAKTGKQLIEWYKDIIT